MGGNFSVFTPKKNLSSSNQCIAKNFYFYSSKITKFSQVAKLNC